MGTTVLLGRKLVAEQALDLEAVRSVLRKKW
jgi:hypothetical protein